METKNLKRIEINSNILCGKPIIKGTRISVEMILEKLAFGYSFDQIKYDYDIKDEDIKAAILYSYKIVANEEILEVA
ncbi:DUF433 domain-containing protein [candidate division KSB1 bacterium]|nr:DUF433 domain-containing protein [candidate division KSB1 bacterium]